MTCLAALCVAIHLAAPRIARADASADAELSFDNITITPASGTLVVSNWTGSVYGQATVTSQSSSGASPSVFVTGDYSTASGSADATTPGAASTADASVTGVEADNASGQGWVTTLFMITGGSGDVSTVFSAAIDSTATVLTDVNGQLAQAENVFSLEVDGGNPVLFNDQFFSIGPSDYNTQNTTTVLSDSMTLQYNKKQLGSTNESKKKKVNILHGHRSLPLNQLSTPLDSDQDQEEVEEDSSTTTTEPVVQSDVDYEENLHSDHLNHRPLVISKSPKAFRDEIDSLKASMRQMEMKIEELNEQKETDSDNKLNSAYDLNLVPRPPPFTPSPQHLRTRAPLFFVGVAHNTSAAEWSDWSEWAECFCSRQLRTRTCEYEASYLTAGCVGVSYESRVCSGGVPCPTTTEPPHVSTLSAVTAREFYTLAPQIGPLAGYAFRPNYLAQSMARLTELRRVQR